MLPDKLGRQRWHLFAVRVPHGSAVRQQDLLGVHQGGRCQRSWVSPPNYLHLLLGTKQSTVLETPWWWTAWRSWAAFWRRTWSPLLLLAPSAHLSGLLQDPVADLWSRVQGCASIKRRQLLLPSAQLRRLRWRLLSLLTLFVIHFFPFLVFLLFTFLLFFGRNVWPPFFSSSPLFCLQPHNSHLIHLLPLLGTYLNKVGVPRLLLRFHWLVLASMDKEIVRQHKCGLSCDVLFCLRWHGGRPHPQYLSPSGPRRSAPRWHVLLVLFLPRRSACGSNGISSAKWNPTCWAPQCRGHARATSHLLVQPHPLLQRVSWHLLSPELQGV